MHSGQVTSTHFCKIPWGTKSLPFNERECSPWIQKYSRFVAARAIQDAVLCESVIRG